jgi:anti-anti-sigma factor
MSNAVEVQSVSSSLAIVALVGDHDLSDVGPLEAAFGRAALRAPSVIADLSECTFIDSAVIAALLHAQRVTQQNGGRLAVALPEPNAVTRVAALVHLPELMPTYPSLADALASFPQGDSLTIRVEAPVIL